MEDFAYGELPEHAFDVEWVVKTFECSRAEAEAQVAASKQEVIYLNDKYQVNARRIAVGDKWPSDMIWLSIKRRDKAPIHDWRDLQTIKNMLVGEEHEAVELYPAESRLVDTANQYHLWVFADSKIRLPFGFKVRTVGGPEAAAKTGAVQRPFEEGDPHE